MKKLSVVAAIIKNEGKILCVKRGAHRNEEVSFKYEFPGGKIEIGETREAALTREIYEELNLSISVEFEFTKVTHNYNEFCIEMTCFVCNSIETTPVLTEHIDYVWLHPSELMNLNWAPADIPVVQKLAAL